MKTEIFVTGVRTLKTNSGNTGTWRLSAMSGSDGPRFGLSEGACSRGTSVCAWTLRDDDR